MLDAGCCRHDWADLSPATSLSYTSMINGKHGLESAASPKTNKNKTVTWENCDTCSAND